jgi:cell division control protein 6
VDNLKDPKVFHPAYIPDNIKLRDEANWIATALVNHIDRNMIEYIYLAGLTGSGKTVTVRYLANEMSKYAKEKGIELPIIYVPCYVYNTSYSALRMVTDSPQGTSWSLLVERAIKKISGKKTVVILDDIDKLSDIRFYRSKMDDPCYTDRCAPRRRPSKPPLVKAIPEILYLLFENTDASVIFISDSPLWLETLDPDFVGVYMPERVFFSPYTPAELYSILKQRAELGLHAFDEKGLEYIANFVARFYHGNAGIAIRALYYAGSKNKWEKEEIERFFRLSPSIEKA